jgi:uncharacterized membrane protein
LEIDRSAALTTHKEIEIDAPPETVWAVQTGIEFWPEWQDDVSSVEVGGELAVGTSFKWKANGASIRSTVQELEPGRSIGWTGKSLGMQAIHVWRFEPSGSGTRVVTEESLSGWFATLLRLFDRAFLDKSLAGALRALKDEAERRTASGPGPQGQG